MRCVHFDGPNDGAVAEYLTKTGTPTHVDGEPASTDGQYVLLDRTDETADGETIGYYVWSAKRGRLSNRGKTANKSSINAG